MARIHPENARKRRVAVISPRSYNQRHGSRPGRCIVIPFSATQPAVLKASDVFFPSGPYQSLTKSTWASCDAVAAVSHSRLDRVRITGGKFSDEILSTIHLRSL